MLSFLADVGPLRKYGEFRRLWIAFAISTVGLQLAMVAVAFQVYRLTSSSLDVGLVSLVQLGPALAGALIGGSIADAVDRKKLLVVVAIGIGACSVGLGVNAQSERASLTAVFVIAALLAAFQGVWGPTVVATLISIVDSSSLVAATALRQIAQQFSIVVGPAVGGVLLASFGLRSVYWVNVAIVLIGLALLAKVGSHPPAGGATRFGWRSISEGFTFLRGRQSIQGCFVADLNATILGMPTSLFPALGVSHFHGGATAVGLLYAAPGAGALGATIFSGWAGRVRYLGRAVCFSIVVWGIAITVFGLAPWLPVALVLLGVAGAADVMSAVFRSTIIQSEVNDRLRGRISSIQQAVVNAGPRLGNTEAGLVAAFSNVQISVVSGGLGCLVGIALVARLMPRFAGYVRGEHASADEPLTALERGEPAPEPL
jgi:ENTS family enterobactin (siderophore) exporter